MGEVLLFYVIYWHLSVSPLSIILPSLQVRQFTCSNENESFGFLNDVSNGPYPPNHATKEAEPKSLDGPSPAGQLERTSMVLSFFAFELYVVSSITLLFGKILSVDFSHLE